ncbi:MAG: hypothetical protein HWE30_18985 [Methylocystaceae bacterium]|nr:hypothetical protein [Methylocystaceae bacterium]
MKAACTVPTLFRLLSVLLGVLGPTGIAEAKDMTFKMVYMNHTNVIVAEGDITGETPEAFEAFLATDPFDGFRFVVALHSGGGNLVGGLRLGQMIREAGLDTQVEHYPVDPSTGEPDRSSVQGACYSACAIAFLGGVRRVVPEGGQLGFHQFSSAGSSFETLESVYMTESTAQLMGATVLGYILNMGAKPELFAQLSEALPHEMWLPRRDELSNLRVVTPERFRDFSFEPYREGVISYAMLPENVAGRSVVGQVTAYCKGGAPYLLLSAISSEHGVSLPTRELIEEEQNGFQIVAEGTGQSAVYGRRSVTVRMSEGLPLAELRLDTRGVELMKSYPALVSVDFPAVVGAMFYLRTAPSESDRAALDAAFRLCIY